jgi:hypothetical protein
LELRSYHACGNALGNTVVAVNAKNAAAANAQKEVMNNDSSLRNRVIEILKERAAPQDPATLIKELENRGIDPEELRRAIWHLVGRKELEFTREWKLRYVPAEELVPA